MSDDVPDECDHVLMNKVGAKVIFHVHGNQVNVERYQWNDDDQEYDLRVFWKPMFRPEARNLYRSFCSEGYASPVAEFAIKATKEKSDD